MAWAKRVLTIAAAGIASAVAVTPAEAAASARTHVVVIAKMKYGAVPTVRVGDTIVWVNKDILRHTATARDRSFDVDLAPSASAKTVIRHGGAVPFYCRFHPGMKGQINVAGK
jgi:plastocyanin